MNHNKSEIHSLTQTTKIQKNTTKLLIFCNKKIILSNKISYFVIGHKYNKKIIIPNSVKTLEMDYEYHEIECDYNSTCNFVFYNVKIPKSIIFLQMGENCVENILLPNKLIKLNIQNYYELMYMKNDITHTNKNNIIHMNKKFWKKNWKINWKINNI